MTVALVDEHYALCATVFFLLFSFFSRYHDDIKIEEKVILVRMLWQFAVISTLTVVMARHVNEMLITLFDAMRERLRG